MIRLHLNSVLTCHRGVSEILSHFTQRLSFNVSQIAQIFLGPAERKEIKEIYGAHRSHRSHRFFQGPTEMKEIKEIYGAS